MFPKWPRAASVITGTVLFPLIAIPLCFIFGGWIGDYNFDKDYAMWVVVPWVTIIAGPIFGYLYGAAGAGLFLLMDRHRRRKTRHDKLPQCGRQNGRTIRPAKTNRIPHL